MNNFAAILISLAAVHQTYATTLSSTNDGLYLAVAGWSQNVQGGFVDSEAIHFDDQLVWHAFCNTGSVEVQYPDRSFGIKIGMFGPNGKEVSKTPLGMTLGSKWDQLQSYREDIPVFGGMTAGWPYDPRGGEFSGPLLPPPKELFQMEKPGTYTLEIEMKVFKVIKNTNRWDRELIRFPPMKIKTVKPVDEKPAKP